METLLLNEEQEKKLKTNGYVVFRNLIPAQVIAELADFHSRFNDPTLAEDELINTMATNQDESYRSNTIQLFKKLFTPILETVSHNYKILGGSFIIKPSGGGVIKPHQDAMIVNEEQYESYGLWVPLKKTNRDNGCMRVLQGSHLLNTGYRMFDSTMSFDEYTDEINEKSISVPLNPGDALLFDHKLIHGSPVNKSKEPRIAVSCAVTYRNAQLFFYKRDDGQVKRYLIDETFFRHPDIGKMGGAYPLEKEFPYHPGDPAILKSFLQNKNMNKPRFLKDADHNSDLLKYGYTVIDLLNPSEVEHLVNEYYKHHTMNKEGIYATAQMDDLELRNYYFNLIKSVFSRPITEHFDQIDPLGGSFVVKYPDPSSLVRPHQDWSHVDEEYFTSYNIWVPLTNLDDKSSQLMVLPFSHTWMKNFRHSSISSVYENVEDIIWKYMKPIQGIKAGQAVVYDHRLIHASVANASDTPRLAIAYGAMASGAELTLYWNQNGILEEYNYTEQYVRDENITQRPTKLPINREIQYDFPKVTPRQLYQLLKKPLGIIGYSLGKRFRSKRS